MDIQEWEHTRLFPVLPSRSASGSDNASELWTLNPPHLYCRIPSPFCFYSWWCPGKLMSDHSYNTRLCTYTASNEILWIIDHRKKGSIRLCVLQMVILRWMIDSAQRFSLGAATHSILFLKKIMNLARSNRMKYLLSIE